MDAAEVELVRKSFEGALPAMTDDVSSVLAELGWDELHRAEPMVAVAELFEAQGRLLASTAALDIVVAAAAGLVLPPGTAVLHPVPGSDEPPGHLGVDGRVAFSGVVLAGAGRMGPMAVPFVTPGGTLGVVTAGAADVNARPVGGLDPAMGLVSVTGTGLAASDPSGGAAHWATVRQAARRALAHELCALAEEMLDQAARHVTDRHQFGRPIAAFQTVRHRLTEVYVAIAAARASLDAAWCTDEPTMADAAKALAGRAATLAGRHCLQVTGAIGFTEEHPLPAGLRRAGVLDALYGSAAELRGELGRSLLENRTVPRLAPLP